MRATRAPCRAAAAPAAGLWRGSLALSLPAYSAQCGMRGSASVAFARRAVRTTAVVYLDRLSTSARLTRHPNRRRRTMYFAELLAGGLAIGCVYSLVVLGFA